MTSTTSAWRGTSYPNSGMEEQPHGRLDRVTWNLLDINLALVGLGLDGEDLLD